MYCTEFELRQAEFNELKNILRKEFIDEKVKEKLQSEAKKCAKKLHSI